MEDPVEPRRLPVLDAKRDDVLHVHLHGAAGAQHVAAVFFDDVHPKPLDTELLADERCERLHRPAKLPTEHSEELLRLLIARPLIHEHPEAPVAVRHHLWTVDDRRNRDPPDVDVAACSRRVCGA